MFLALERKNLDRSKLQIEKVHGNIGLRNSHYFDTRPSNSCTTTANLLQEKRVPFKMEKLLEYSVRCRHANNFHEPRFLPTNNERGRDVANRITENIILLFRYFYDILLDPDPDFPAHKFRICQFVASWRSWIIVQQLITFLNSP